MYRFEDFIEKSQEVETVDDLSRLYSGMIKSEGYENCILTSVRSKDVGHVCWFDFPNGYAEAYIEKRWAEIDPVLAATLRAPRPFLWGDVCPPDTLSQDQIRFLNDCRDMQVHSGIVFPMHGPGNRLEVLSISRRTNEPPNRERLKYLHAVSVQTWARFLELSEASSFPGFDMIHLTPRESEVLNWCKHGKSYSDVGDILSISPKTVEFHVGNAMNKLGACNKVSAVVIAIQQGLIEL